MGCVVDDPGPGTAAFRHDGLLRIVANTISPSTTLLVFDALATENRALKLNIIPRTGKMTYHVDGSVDVVFTVTPVIGEFKSTWSTAFACYYPSIKVHIMLSGVSRILKTYSS